MNKGIILFLFIASIILASADVGLVVQFPNGTIYTDCMRSFDGKSAYNLLEKTDMNILWSPDSPFGRMLCKIDDIGDDVGPDGYCEWSGSYWAFSLSLGRDNGWTMHSPVGFTAGGCWNREEDSFDGHYCSKDGDVIGLEYTDDFPSGYPRFFDFDELCPLEKSGPIKKSILMSSRPFWRQYSEECGIEYDETLSPQDLRKICDEKKANQSGAGFDNLSIAQQNNSLGGTVAKEFSLLKKISFDFNPKLIEDLSEPFNVSFSSSGSVLQNLSVLVNGLVYTTDSEGEISFSISRGDYLVEVYQPGFEVLRIIFRIGG